MKQHITAEQFAEIKPTKEEGFGKWMIDQGYWDINKYGEEIGDTKIGDYFQQLHGAAYDYQDLPSIGQMIGFLVLKDSLEEIVIVKNDGEEAEVYDNQWRGREEEKRKREKQGYAWHVYRNSLSFHDGSELCDALWEAVKYTLEKEND